VVLARNDDDDDAHKSVNFFVIILCFKKQTKTWLNQTTDLSAMV